MTTAVSTRGGRLRLLKQRILAGVVLFGMWVLLSGKLEVFHLGVGVLSVWGALWMHAHMPQLELVDHPLLRPFRCITYLIWLLWQMVLSALHVAWVILRRENSGLDPRLIAFKSPQPSLVQSVLFGNSITLTPGTLTLDLQDNRYLVHALTDETASDVLSGNMAKRVAYLSGPVDEEPMVEAVSTEDWEVKM